MDEIVIYQIGDGALALIHETPKEARPFLRGFLFS
jgi:hypothetical protein